MFVDGMCALRTAGLHVYFVHPPEKRTVRMLAQQTWKGTGIKTFAATSDDQVYPRHTGCIATAAPFRA